MGSFLTPPLHLRVNWTQVCLIYEKSSHCDVQKECYMTFNMIMAVCVLFGMNENSPIEENNKMSKNIKSYFYGKGIIF